MPPPDLWCNPFLQLIPVLTIPTRFVRLLHLAQAPPHPARQDLIPNLRSRQRGLLARPIIRRSNLDDISPNHIQALETAQDANQFPRCPAACFRCSGAWTL